MPTVAQAPVTVMGNAIPGLAAATLSMSAAIPSAMQQAGLPASISPLARPVVAPTYIPPAVQARSPVYLTFQNQVYRIEGDLFVIGRGLDAQLTIRDSNISRKHCAIKWQNGYYVIQDLGSTNGIEYQGQRIDVKRIEEGDRFMLCNYELRFSLNEP